MCEGWKQIHNSPSRVCQQTFSIWKLKMLIVDSEGLTRQLVRKLCWSSSELFVLIYPRIFKLSSILLLAKHKQSKVCQRNFMDHFDSTLWRFSCQTLLETFFCGNFLSSWAKESFFISTFHLVKQEVTIQCRAGSFSSKPQVDLLCSE